MTPRALLLCLDYLPIRMHHLKIFHQVPGCSKIFHVNNLIILKLEVHPRLQRQLSPSTCQRSALAYTRKKKSYQRNDRMMLTLGFHFKEVPLQTTS